MPKRETTTRKKFVSHSSWRLRDPVGRRDRKPGADVVESVVVEGSGPQHMMMMMMIYTFRLGDDSSYLIVILHYKSLNCVVGGNKRVSIVCEHEDGLTF